MDMAPYVLRIRPCCCGIYGLRSCVAEVGSETYRMARVWGWGDAAHSLGTRVAELRELSVRGEWAQGNGV